MTQLSPSLPAGAEPRRFRADASERGKGELGAGDLLARGAWLSPRRPPRALHRPTLRWAGRLGLPGASLAAPTDTLGGFGPARPGQWVPTSPRGPHARPQGRVSPRVPAQRCVLTGLPVRRPCPSRARCRCPSRGALCHQGCFSGHGSVWIEAVRVVAQLRCPATAGGAHPRAPPGSFLQPLSCPELCAGRPAGPPGRRSAQVCPPPAAVQGKGLLCPRGQRCRASAGSCHVL